MFVGKCTIDIHKQPRIASNSPLDDTTGTKLECQRRFALVAGVELGSVGLQGAAVVHGNSVAVDCLAGALDSVGDFDAELGGSRERAKGCDEDGSETHCVFVGLIGKRGIREMRSLGMWTDTWAEIGPRFSVGLCFKLMVARFTSMVVKSRIHYKEIFIA